MLAGMEEVGTGLLDRLDAMQRVAASAPGGPLLIVAGPGTGKTRTLTHRIAYLCAELDVYPEQCLAITFTRRAAEELRAPAGGAARPGRRGRHRRHLPRARPDDPAGERRGRRPAAAEPDRSPRSPTDCRAPAAPPGRQARQTTLGRRTRSCCASRTWSTWTSCSPCRSALLRGTDSAGRPLPGPLAVDLRRRVPGRRRGPVRAAAAALPGRRQPLRDRRPGPGDLLVPGRGRRVTSCGSPRTSPTPGWSG